MYCLHFTHRSQEHLHRRLRIDRVSLPRFKKTILHFVSEPTRPFYHMARI